ncbi:MAG TPA: hypothetical protein PLP69_00510 [Bacteroidales bacterium]|nr:hypothetical protein [Bacteroidales bacterium]
MQDDGKKPSKLPKLGEVPAVAWLGGISMAGGLVALSLLFSGKSEKLDNLDKKYTETVISYNSHVDSLSDELKRLTSEYYNLVAHNDSMGESLEGEKAKNLKLTAANATLSSREQQYKKNFNSLLSTSGKINDENKKLKNETDAMREEIANLEEKLADAGKTSRQQESLIAEQTNTIESVTADAAGLRDSLKQEDVSGWFNNTELGGGYGLYLTDNPNAYYFYGVTTVNGYVINKHFLTGIGTGLNHYDSGWLVPLYLDFRYTFPRGRYTPYIFADGGFQVDIEHFKLPNSVFMNPGVGVYKIITNRLAINMGAGLFVQQYDFRSAFINLKVGLFFKK